MPLALQATHELHEQLRCQQFDLYRPNPRMLPAEVGIPQRLDVDCSLKTPQKVLACARKLVQVLFR